MDNIMDDVDDQSAEWLLPTHSSGTFDIFGDPQKTPRVGDEFQAKIPTFISENDRFQLIKSSICRDPMINFQTHLNFGLSIPVMWIKDTMEVHLTTDVTKVNSNGPIETEKEMNFDFVPFPGSLGESWSVLERESFHLGLYIFGKNLRLVNKFMGNKGIGNVMAYYYGEFYRSVEYKRWSKCRKKRSRKSIIHGDRIFVGWRQQELLSRLSAHVTDDCKNSLAEASKMFGDGKLSFEEYVFTLKSKVGINLLVEAIAIGKDKQDLTGTAMEPLKTNNSFHGRHDIPKACSSLTTEEIVKFLTGDIRLSKAKSSDLFWEAVWPRLLARGWHSEQPRNYIFQKSKHCLVFLVPGVAKFSRRKLEKGSHYFDSPTDVLNKVASEPELLELEGDQDSVDPQKEEQKQHCYLQTNVPRSNQDLLKFTIVDTSLNRGENGVSKVTELRSLPFIEPNSSGVSGETEEETTEESQNEEDVNNGSHRVLDSQECETSTVNNDMVNDLVNCLEPMVSRIEDKKTDVSTDGQSRRTMKIKFNPKVKPRKSCNESKPNDKFNKKSKPCKLSDLNASAIEKCESYSESKPDETTSQNYGFFQEKTHVNDDEYEAMEEHGREKKRRRTLIDLNLPQMAPDSDTEESLLSANPSVMPEISNFTNSVDSIEQKPVVNVQRQSTRNRPLTTKALEALAGGYLRPKKKRKSAEERPLKRVRAKTALVSSCGVGDVEKGVDGVFSGSSQMVCDSPK